MPESDFYNQCWDILVENVGANRSGRDHFVWTFHQPKPPIEYRFIGSLGFGGKFWRYDGKHYITCYPEDETPERLKAIECVNTLLACLKPAF